MASFVVVADRDGFVGAFDDLAAARAATEKYRGRIPMVYSQYPRAAPGSDTVWALPYLHAPAVAYASDCAVAAKKAQDALARLGLVPDDDDLAYWEQAMHCIVPSAQRRFDIVTGGSAEADEFHLDQFLLIIGTAPAPLDSAPADDEAAPDPPVFDPPTDDTPPEAAPDPPTDDTPPRGGPRFSCGRGMVQRRYGGRLAGERHLTGGRRLAGEQCLSARRHSGGRCHGRSGGRRRRRRSGRRRGRPGKTGVA